MTKSNGFPCKNCNTSEWDRHNHCVVCSKETSKRFRQKNPDYFRQWQRDHPYSEEVKERRYKRRREWGRENRDKIRANNQRFYRNNRERAVKTSKEWRLKNIERSREHLRRWNKAHPEVMKAAKHRYRAKKSEVGGSFAAAEWRLLCRRYGNHCVFPGCSRTDLHADHVIPISKGGTSDIDNIQPLCAHHNLSKSDKIIDYRYKPGAARWVQPSLFD